MRGEASASIGHIYTIILLMDTVTHLTSVALICGLYRPSSEPNALPNVLKCSTRHTCFTVKFWHFSSAAFVEKKRRTGTYASDHNNFNEEEIDALIEYLCTH